MIFVSCEDPGFDYYSSGSPEPSRHPRHVPQTPPTPITQPAYFPNAIGSQWKYAISGFTRFLNTTDTAEIITDTVIVTISDSLRLTGEVPAMVWQYRYLHLIVTFYVVSNGDTLFSTQNPSPPGERDLQYIFPLSDGKSWSTFSSIFYVSAQNEIIVPANTFSSGYKIEENLSEPNYSQITDDWIVPHVGLVRRDFQSYSTTSLIGVNYTWRLLSYKLK